MTIDPQPPTIDVPLLRKELEYITANRIHWSQCDWIYRAACGTFGCLAGNVALNAGYMPVFHRFQSTTAFVTLDRASVHAWRSSVLPSFVRIEPVSEVAERLLGLTPDEAGRLFEANNTLLDLWTIASELTNGEIEVPQVVIDEAHDNGNDVPNGRTMIRADAEVRYHLRMTVGVGNWKGKYRPNLRGGA